MIPDEFDAKCKALCPHCAAGAVLRQREDTLEWVHDFAFGAIDPKLGRPAGIGHGICLAHEFRKNNVAT